MYGIPLIVMLLGLITGFGFGLAIYAVGASSYDKILGLHRLQDFAILKFMMVAVTVASIGVYALVGLGRIQLMVIPVWLWAEIIGGAIFGIGWAITGYCPGTSMVAIGEGKRDAMYTILGGILGAAVYAQFWPWFYAHIISPGYLGQLTVPSALSINNWAGVILVAVIFVAGLFVVELIEKRQAPDEIPDQISDKIKLNA